MRHIGKAGSATTFFLVAAVALGGCQTNQQTGGLFGAGGGAVLGGLLGNAIGNDQTSTLIGAGIGAIGGYFIGSAIGQRLDEADRQRAEQTTQQVLTSPRKRATRSWSNSRTGVRGSSTVVAAAPRSGGGECRTVREVAYIKGEEVQQESRYCRNAGGEWAAA